MSTTIYDQDPVFDHSNGQKTAVTALANIFTPGAACVFVWIGTDAAIVINAAGNAAVDDGTSAYVAAGTAGIFPCTASTAIFGLSLSGTANVRCVAMQRRPIGVP